MLGPSRRMAFAAPTQSVWLFCARVASPDPPIRIATTPVRVESYLEVNHKVSSEDRRRRSSSMSRGAALPTGQRDERSASGLANGASVECGGFREDLYYRRGSRGSAGSSPPR